jgi:hypothetical protein
MGMLGEKKGSVDISLNFLDLSNNDIESELKILTTADIDL